MLNAYLDGYDELTTDPTNMGAHTAGPSGVQARPADTSTPASGPLPTLRLSPGGHPIGQGGPVPSLQVLGMAGGSVAGGGAMLGGAGALKGPGGVAAQLGQRPSLGGPPPGYIPGQGLAGHPHQHPHLMRQMSAQPQRAAGGLGSPRGVGSAQANSPTGAHSPAGAPGSIGLMAGRSSVGAPTRLAGPLAGATATAAAAAAVVQALAAQRGSASQTPLMGAPSLPRPGSTAGPGGQSRMSNPGGNNIMVPSPGSSGQRHSPSNPGIAGPGGPGAGAGSVAGSPGPARTLSAQHQQLNLAAERAMLAMQAQQPGGAGAAGAAGAKGEASQVPGPGGGVGWGRSSSAKEPIPAQRLGSAGSGGLDVSSVRRMHGGVLGSMAGVAPAAGGGAAEEPLMLLSTGGEEASPDAAQRISPRGLHVHGGSTSMRAPPTVGRSRLSNPGLPGAGPLGGALLPLPEAASASSGGSSQPTAVGTQGAPHSPARAFLPEVPESKERESRG